MSSKDGKITIALIAIFAMDDSDAGGRGSMCVHGEGEKPDLAAASAGLEAVRRVSGLGKPRVRIRGSRL